MLLKYNIQFADDIVRQNLCKEYVSCIVNIEDGSH